MQLREIVESEHLILMDSSVRLEDYWCFARILYEATKPSQLKVSDLKKEINSLENVLDLMKNQKIHTIKEVTQEFKNYEEIINGKIRYFDSRSKGKRRLEKRNKQFVIKQKELLQELQETTFNIRKLSKQKELEGCQEYNLLTEMVKIVESKINLKRDMGFIMGKRERDSAHDSDTDEKLASALYWLCLNKLESPCLITRDKDFQYILGVITPIIGSDSFLPYNAKFRLKLNENPFKLYKKNGRVKDPNEYGLHFLSSNMPLDKTFKIRNIPTTENLMIREEILQRWKKLAKISTYSPKPQDNSLLQTSQH